MTQIQKLVAYQIAAALATAIIVFVLSMAQPLLLTTGGSETDFRAKVFATSALAPLLSLAIGIGRLAKHRFVSPKDIDGSAVTGGSSRAQLLQAVLQNTLEQVVLAVPTYAAGCVFLPARALPAVLAASFMFSAGRLLFFIGYANGATGRAYGFGLTFYPTVLLLVATVVLAIVGAVA